MPGDRERAGKRKMAAVIEAWTPRDMSWQKFKNCEMCGKKICVNNWEDHKSRTPKLYGIIICPWCQHTENSDLRVREHLVFKKLADIGCLRILAGKEGKEGCKCPGCIAREAMAIEVVTCSWCGNQHRAKPHCPFCGRSEAND